MAAARYIERPPARTYSHDSPQPGSSGSIQIGFSVDEPLDDVVKDLQSRGVVFRGPIIDDVQVRLAFFGDPDGNALYLTEVKKWS